MGSADRDAYRMGRELERQIYDHEKSQIAALGEELVESQLQAAAAEAASEYYKQRLFSDMQSSGFTRAAQTEEGILDRLPEKIRRREQGKGIADDDDLEDLDLTDLEDFKAALASTGSNDPREWKTVTTQVNPWNKTEKTAKSCRTKWTKVYHRVP